MRIKTGDKVIIISGKDKGKTGSVIEALPRENKIIVEGVNVRKRHTRSRKAGTKGQIVEKPLPIHVSNAQVVDPKSSKGTRIKISREGGKRVRIAVKSGSALEK